MSDARLPFAGETLHEAATAGPRPDPGASSGATVRFLSPRELGAIDRLRRLGAARLGAEVGEGELRHAFRVLARRYHPDVHPEATASERVTYARLFAELCDAYRVLRGGITAGVRSQGPGIRG